MIVTIRIIIINECGLPEDVGATAATLSFFFLTAWHLALMVSQKCRQGICHNRGHTQIGSDPSIASLISTDGLVQNRRFPRKVYDFNFNVIFFAHVSAEAVLDIIVLLKFLFRSTGVQVLVRKTPKYNKHLHKSCVLDFYNLLQLLTSILAPNDRCPKTVPFATLWIYICWRSMSRKTTLLWIYSKKHRRLLSNWDFGHLTTPPRPCAAGWVVGAGTKQALWTRSSCKWLD